MTKLGIYSGTAANAMTGIKGITVSNEAPFTGTSPQIDIRYTGLNRAALVNLFKSLPYNNGYVVSGDTIVSDGEITNNVANTSSAFTKLALKQNIQSAEFIFHVRWRGETPYVTTGNFFPIAGFGNQSGITSSSSRQYITHGNRKTTFHTGYNNETTEGVYISDDEFNFPDAVNSATGAYIKLNYSVVGNNTYNYVISGSTDGETWVSSSTLTSAEPLHYGAISLLKDRSGAQQYGVLILNGTKATVNSIPWLDGNLAVMTKTCSVVGCTGTADLTADDKAIATGKGWELTVE
jgi:hypothetical protein